STPPVSTSCDRSRSLSRPAIPSRARCRRVHRNPIPTFGNDGQRPFLGDRTAGVLEVICPTAKAKFCPTGCFVAASATVSREAAFLLPELSYMRESLDR